MTRRLAGPSRGAMPRQLLAAFALLLCIACDHGVPVAPPPPPPPGNHAPTVTLSGPATGREGALVSVSAALSDPDHDTLTCTWSTGDGRTFSRSVGPMSQNGWRYLADNGFQYADNGTYTISLIIADPSGAADTASITLTVLNESPRIESISPPSVQAAGEVATILVQISDPGTGDTHTLTVHWGDGTSESVAARDSAMWLPDHVHHIYAKPGQYVVGATVRDDDGGADSATAVHPLVVYDPTEHRTVAGYDVFDLGTLGGNSALPADLNDRSQVVGSSATASENTHAFLWDGQIHDLGSMGHDGSAAARINNTGLIAGVAWTNVNAGEFQRATVPAVWRDGSGALLDKTALDTMQERGPVFLADLNERGDALWTVTGHEDSYGWLWRNDTWRPLGTLYASGFFGGPGSAERPRASCWHESRTRARGVAGVSRISVGSRFPA